jgi:hypothetical protein
MTFLPRVHKHLPQAPRLPSLSFERLLSNPPFHNPDKDQRRYLSQKVFLTQIPRKAKVGRRQPLRRRRDVESESKPDLRGQLLGLQAKKIVGTNDALVCMSDTSPGKMEGRLDENEVAATVMEVVDDASEKTPGLPCFRGGSRGTVPGFVVLLDWRMKRRSKR